MGFTLRSALYSAAKLCAWRSVRRVALLGALTHLRLEEGRRAGQWGVAELGVAQQGFEGGIDNRGFGGWCRRGRSAAPCGAYA
jgi:hypothetical protein